MFSRVCVCSQMGGYPSPRFLVPGPFQGVPQSWLGVPQSQGRGYPSPRGGVPQDEGTPPARTGLGYSPAGIVVPPPPPRQNSRESTCYTVGSVPLAFMQRTFLWFEEHNVLRYLWKLQKHSPAN